MRQAGADGYAFFLKTPGLGFLRQDAGGDAITEDGLANPLAVTYPLGTDGVLAFAFHDHARLREARPELDRIAGAIEAVWRAAHTEEQYSQLASRVAELETSLMDSKIADRTLGFLSASCQDPIEAIARHVEGVLQETSTRRTLERFCASWRKKWKSGGWWAKPKPSSRSRKKCQKKKPTHISVWSAGSREGE